MPLKDPLSALAPAGALAVVAPHPDDETLGCGGLLAMAAAAGRDAVVILLTDGAASHPGSRREPPAVLARRRGEEIRRALDVLGLGTEALVALGLPDGRLSEAPAGPIVARLTGILRARGVATVFATRPDDPHPDHRRAHALAAAAADRVGAALWTYPVRAHGRPQGSAERLTRLPIGAVLAVKAAALRRHASQWPGGVPDDPDGFSLTQADLDFHLSGEELYARAGSP